MAELDNQIDERLQGLLAGLDASGRRQLARHIATELRRSQQSRIRAQQNPDGSAFEARVPRLRKEKGKIRRAMFAKIATAKYLKTRSDENTASVEITGRAARIARVHQEGLRERIGSLGPDYTYPAREILGMSRDDMGAVEALLIEQLAVLLEKDTRK